MNLKYLRLPQDGSDLLYQENEKERNGRQPQWLSRRNLMLSLSVVVNIFLSLSLVSMLREKPTPTGFGKHKPICVRASRLIVLSQS